MAGLVSTANEQLPPGIRITGSNGKGSTARMTAEILSAHGFKCGLYTSPHLFSVHERFQINGTNIQERAFNDHLTRALELSETIANGHFSRFEILTATAAFWFAEQKIDAVVWEVGIGGRLDPTRLFPASVGVLTQLALEHTNILGTDLETIALDKAAVVDVHTPLVVGPLPVSIRQQLMRERTLINSIDKNCGMQGQHQRENAGCAYTASQHFLKEQFDNTLAESALMHCQWPLRMEKVADNPPVWIDVAHNVSGLLRVSACLPEGPKVLVFGASDDRPYVEMAKALIDQFDHIIFTQAQHKGTPPHLIRQALSCNADVINSVRKAVIRAIQLASDIQGSVIVTGGLFLAAEAATIFNGKELKSMSFL